MASKNTLKIDTSQTTALIRSIIDTLRPTKHAVDTITAPCSLERDRARATIQMLTPVLDDLCIASVTFKPTSGMGSLHRYGETKKRRIGFEVYAYGYHRLRLWHVNASSTHGRDLAPGVHGWFVSSTYNADERVDLDEINRTIAVGDEWPGMDMSYEATLKRAKDAIIGHLGKLASDLADEQIASR